MRLLDTKIKVIFQAQIYEKNFNLIINLKYLRNYATVINNIKTIYIQNL